MKNTRENVIKLLQQMELNVYKMNEYLKGDGEQEMANKCAGEQQGLYIARLLLETEECFNDFYEICNRDYTK